MRLSNLFIALLSIFVIGALSVPSDADARRFGGGSSLGKQSHHASRQAPQRRQQAEQGARNNTASAQQPKSGASKWLGPLAGIAAGGLLAAMLFGDGFQGFQIFDLLMIVLLAVGAFLLLRKFRGRSQAPLAGAGAGAHVPPASTHVQRFEQAATGGRPAGVLPAVGAAAMQANDALPGWFDEAAFLDAAKTHFIRLQAAWDRADFRDIRDYTTPELYAELQREREKTPGDQFTEVVQLAVELIGSQREDDLLVVSVLFSGLIREDQQAVAERFAEVWNIQHPWGGPDGSWYIAGIQQQQDEAEQPAG